MIVCTLLSPTIALLTAMKSDLVILFFPLLLIFLLGLIRVFYAVRKPSDKTTTSVTSAMTQQLNVPGHAALPPSNEALPIQNWRQPVTAEMSRPQSVTEGTTRLLDED